MEIPDKNESIEQPPYNVLYTENCSRISHTTNKLGSQNKTFLITFHKSLLRWFILTIMFTEVNLAANVKAKAIKVQKI